MEREAYALGYYHGRSIGNDEGLGSELEARVGEHCIENDDLFAAAKAGYERGVSDYVEYDMCDEKES